MPFNKDPETGGTNADGSKSHLYCSYCYQEGVFTQPDFTVHDMQQFCKLKMKEMGIPGFLAGLFVKRIPKLERWEKA